MRTVLQRCALHKHDHSVNYAGVDAYGQRRHSCGCRYVDVPDQTLAERYPNPARYVVGKLRGGRWVKLVAWDGEHRVYSVINDLTKTNGQTEAIRLVPFDDFESFTL